MANIVFKDGAAATKYLKASGAGTDGDPFIPEQAVTVTGGATAANQTTGNASLATLAGAVAGTEVQVDVLTLPNVTVGAALPAGTNNIGDVDVASVTLPATLYHGQTTVTTAGTEVALASSQAIASGVTVKALHGNTGWIYVGKNPVTSTTGYVLDAGESVFLEVANLSTIYVDSSVNGEGVSYIAS